jgi:hypothetical protein
MWLLVMLLILWFRPHTWNPTATSQLDTIQIHNLKVEKQTIHTERIRTEQAYDTLILYLSDSLADVRTTERLLAIHRFIDSGGQLSSVARSKSERASDSNGERIGD